MMRKEVSSELLDPWYHRVLRGAAGHRGGKLHGNKPQRRTVYIICAAVAVCTLIVFGVSNPIDRKPVSAAASVKKAVQAKTANRVATKAAADSEAPASPEEVKRLLKEIDANMQEVLNSNPKFTKFGPRIKDWDQRRAIAKANLKKAADSAGNDTSTTEEADHHQSSKAAPPRILLVTSSHPNSCSNKQGDQMLLKAIKNKVDYCRLHGIEIYYNMDKMDDEMTIWWVKVFLTHMLMLKHPEVDWIWWMDSDAVFTDMSFELPFEKYANYNMVVHGWENSLYEKRSWLALNAGVFILRNCQWSMDLLHAWAPMSPVGPIRDAIGPLLSQALPDRPQGQADDQSALVYLMITDREKWGSKIYLESSYYFQGYWRILTEKFEDMMAKYKPGLYGDDRWPFVTHFCGCEFCEGVLNPEYTPEQCITQMERAINFADNQVISRYGFKHPTLETASVQPIINHSPKSKAVAHH
ncbi:hypothetical protein CY35_14G074900 [Sphagnum magellanicum]|nr:hypothetical protein CY35_14G074900 [Sphagnum magellanicum]